MKITQIVSANPGWFARYKGEGFITHEPVAVWAVVLDNDGHSEVVGFTSGDELGLDHLPRESSNFLGYMFDIESNPNAVIDVPV